MILATRNPHKLREFRRVIGQDRLSELPPEVVLGPRSARPSRERPRQGAYRSAGTGRAAIADDSGIAAQALDGAPGSLRAFCRRARERPGEP